MKIFQLGPTSAPSLILALFHEYHELIKFFRMAPLNLRPKYNYGQFNNFCYNQQNCTFRALVFQKYDVYTLFSDFLAHVLHLFLHYWWDIETNYEGSISGLSIISKYINRSLILDVLNRFEPGTLLAEVRYYAHDAKDKRSAKRY